MPDGVYDYWRIVNMPFCAGSVNYPVCVPKYQVSSLNCYVSRQSCELMKYMLS